MKINYLFFIYKIKKFENKTFLYDKLTLKYWMNKIQYLN